MANNVGRNIKRLREAAGLTQLELANRLNFKKQTISNYERGTREPDIATVGEIAVILGVTVDAIMSDENITRFTASAHTPTEETIIAPSPSLNQRVVELIESEVQSRVEEKIKETGLDEQALRPKWIKLSTGTRSVTDEQLNQIYYAAHLVDPVKFPLDDEKG